MTKTSVQTLLGKSRTYAIPAGSLFFLHFTTHVYVCERPYLIYDLCFFVRYIQSLLEILEFLDRNPDDYKVLGE